MCLFLSFSLLWAQVFCSSSFSERPDDGLTQWKEGEGCELDGSATLFSSNLPLSSVTVSLFVRMQFFSLIFLEE